MKKIVNRPADLVVDSLSGLAEAHADLLELHTDPLFVTRRVRRHDKVAVVSGGGSGHEPLHVGFVGVGMLDAAVPGAVFTSPTPDAIAAAVQAVAGEAGVLALVKNYTGDVLNFEMAAEMIAAGGTTIDTVTIADDVAVTDSTFTAGRRGVAGTVPIEKLVGAAAERGAALPELGELARRLVGSTRSMGLALRAGVVPHTGRESFPLAADQLEFGVGIHGEPGRETRGLGTADELVDELLAAILADGVIRGDRPGVLLFVNGLGGTPPAELYLAYHSAARRLRQLGIDATRSLVGTFVTSLDMQGISVTLLDLDAELLELWDAPVCTPALRKGM